MFASSELNISFKTSNDYRRLALVLHAIVLMVLLQSSWSWSLIMLVSGLLALPLYRMLRSGLPLPRYQRLAYQSSHWCLFEVDGRQQQYKEAAIGFNGGLFILLTLKNDEQQKKLVIFKDQMSVMQYRILTVAVKMT